MKKPEERTVIKIITTLVLIVAIMLAFKWYTNMNSERIFQQNSSYLKSSAVETAGRIEDVLEDAGYSINNTAKLYGMTLKSGEVKSGDLEAIADRTLFDYVEFVNAEGRYVDIQGEHADVSDRSYFIKGMQGESGLDGVYTSRMTGERLVVFYAPLRYQDEIIGVLTGQYKEQRMREILETTMFGENVPSFLCMEDGTIVANTGFGMQGDNVLDYMTGQVSPEEVEGIKAALSEEREYAFVYETARGATAAYMTSLPGNHWTIIQFFPANAFLKMQRRANYAGMLLEAALIVFFAAYVLLLLLQEWYQKKKLLRSKQEADRIIAGINRLFSRFIVVDFEKDSYRYANQQAPGFQGLPPKGRYSDFLAFFDDKFDMGYKDAPLMNQVLTEEYISGQLSREVPFERYEYRVRKEQGDVWENMAIIALEWRDDRPVSVLLAVQEITGLKQKELRTQDALKEACQSAEAANRAKSEFLSRMSHDIRTPMNAIMGMTAIAAMHMDDKVRLEDCLGKITISSQHLLRLINEVLDMSKIESGRLELMIGEFDLSETVNELLGIFHSQIEAKKQNLSVTLSGMVHEKVIGDSQRLSQVLVNIMGNAVKFTPEGGSIALNISELPSRVAGSGCYQFIFKDTGIGMDEEFISKIFEPFSRASDSRTSHIEGTGLGMAIAKNIVSMMNGDIRVKSRKGEGTEIKVIVFLQYDSETEEQINMLPGQRVMVVDDDLAACETACNMLESIHMPSDYYTDSDAAVEALVQDRMGRQEYVVVILDWKMPKKDGVQVAREIREKVGNDVPIIILSAYDWSSIEQEAREAGVNDFIAKPMFRSRLLYVMKRVLLGQEKDTKTVLKKEEQFAGKRLLLVEDNEMNMEIAYEILTMSGFEVDKAENGREAVDILMEKEAGRYQAVLMDIQMPVMNGYEATEALRKSGRKDLEQLPVFAMTADAFSSDIRKAEAAGMNGHIAKPIDIGKLMNTLKDWV